VITASRRPSAWSTCQPASRPVRSSNCLTVRVGAPAMPPMVTTGTLGGRCAVQSQTHTTAVPKTSPAAAAISGHPMTVFMRIANTNQHTTSTPRPTSAPRGCGMRSRHRSGFRRCSARIATMSRMGDTAMSIRSQIRLMGTGPHNRGSSTRIGRSSRPPGSWGPSSAVGWR
jgi:hypothetical protein